MGRFFKYLLLALAISSATFFVDDAFAQDSTATPIPSPQVPLTTPVVSKVTVITADSRTTSPLPEPTASEPLAAPTENNALATPTPAEESTVAQVNNAPLQGTILANRSQSAARFFLEGQTYELEAGRSQGLPLPRASTVLNLFNCPANLAADTAGCFWDPYLIQQDGFYEVYDSTTASNQAVLMLREAGAPPTGQVWVQNRTGKSESIVFKDEVHEIPPTTVLEFPVASGVPAILYVRSCLTIDEQSACEWAPKTLDAGIYYAMVEVDTPGSQAGTMQKAIDLRPVVGEGEEAASAEIAPTQAMGCSVVVPALNIRSGPGLQYDIIGKVRTVNGEAVTVNVTGRSADSQWLTVEPSVAQNGWINNSPNFITCTGDPTTLPIVETPAPPTPLPVAAEETPATTEASDTEASATDATVVEEPETPAITVETVEEATTPATEVVEESTTEAVTSTVPAGQALLVVNNGFQHEMRFTLDQMYRTQEGPSEFDLQPGQSMTIAVFPGDIPFSGSSPWGGLASNAAVHVDPDQSLTLWIRFQLDPDGTWVFAWD